jgi:hypothetical protein
MHCFDFDHRALKLPQTLVRREPQALQRQREIDAELARARRRAAGWRVEQVFFDVANHKAVLLAASLAELG